jgi:hypothetical protein
VDHCELGVDQLHLCGAHADADARRRVIVDMLAVDG